VSDERLDERLARLADEQAAADARYNDALTALDRALAPIPDIPHAPPAYDASRLEAVNQSWDILPSGPPRTDRSLKGRLRGLIWRLAGPPFEAQRRFNAALVDHLNRNVAAHEETAKAAASTIACLKGEIEARARFQAHLIQLLQSVTPYVDTKDRAMGGQTAVINAGLAAIAGDWLKRWESLSVREERFVRALAGIDDVKETAIMAERTALSLKREVERLLASGAPVMSRGDGDRVPAAAPDLDAFKYLGFEDAFRGPQEEIRRRLTEYVPLFAGTADVLDVGCGRGEFLELLGAAGIRARGIDTNQAMVEASRARGLDATMNDALSYLNGLPDGSLGGLFAAQVVEHLEPAYLMALIETAAHKLKPEAVIVLETINPACWLAFFESYIRDLTHVRPIHPETLQYLLRASGFRDLAIAYKSPVGEAARLEDLPAPAAADDSTLADVVHAFNSNVTKLNARLFTYQDYAAIGRR
jgi:SAM-dependent methyltransferase